MSARVCLHGIFCCIKPLQLLILPSDWMIPFIPVAQLAMLICLALAPALILTKENQKKQNINFTTKKFLLFNLLLSSQELHYSSISSVSHDALMQTLCLILCNLGVFAVTLYYLCFSYDFPYGIKWLCLLFHSLEDWTIWSPKFCPSTTSESLNMKIFLLFNG